MSELGQIADMLESASEPGLAAAVRVLEYCEAEQVGVSHLPDDDEVALWPVIGRAEDRLVGMGRPEVAERLVAIYYDVRDYGRILPRQPSTRALNSAS